MQQITLRHNLIIERLKKASSRTWSIYKENQPLAGSTKRPDLVLVHNKENAALVLDVACTFEDGPAAFDKVRTDKVKKYAYLKKSLSDKFKDVSIEATVVGALGS